MNPCIRCGEPTDLGLVCETCSPTPKKYQAQPPPTCPECACELEREPPAGIPWCDDCSAGDTSDTVMRFNWRMRHKHPSQWVDGQRTAKERARVSSWMRAHTEALADMYEKSSAIRSRCTQYGISVADWVFMAVEQDGRCGICGEGGNPTRLSIDHDHHDLHVRGLLCHQCNIGLGNLRIDGTEAVDRARSILAYVLKTAGPPNLERTGIPA